jgi:hypothetical protein
VQAAFERVFFFFVVVYRSSSDDKPLLAHLKDNDSRTECDQQGGVHHIRIELKHPDFYQSFGFFIG